MFKKVFVRGFVVVAAIATGGVAVAAVQTRDTGATVPITSPEVTARPSPLVSSEESDRVAFVNACSGRGLVAAVDADQSARMDQILSERARYAEALSENPLDTGTGFQAGVDEGLHLQALDRDLASILCPTP